MNIRPIYIFLFLFSVAPNFAQKNIILSDVSVSSILIDGLPYEWGETLRYYDGPSKLQFGFKNDSSNLYICIKTNDELAQLKVMAAGMELSIQTSKKNVASIVFPMGKQADRPSQPPLAADTNQRPDIKFMKRKMIGELTHMKLTGFTDLPNGIYNTETKSGIKVAINFDSLDVLTVEYKIPFASLIQKIDPIKPISANIHLYGIHMGAGNGMEPPPGDQMGQQSGGVPVGGMPGGGMGGEMPPGGMGGPSGPPPGMSEMPPLSQEFSIKLKLKLAGW